MKAFGDGKTETIVEAVTLVRNPVRYVRPREGKYGTS